MSEKFQPRTAEVSDLPEVEKLLKECGLPIDGLADQFGESYCIVEHQGELVGVSGIETYNHLGLLRSVAVKPQWRKKSIAGNMVKDRLKWARLKQLSALFLLTTDAGQYFENLGFHQLHRDLVPTEIKDSTEFASACPDSAQVMVLPC